MQNPTVHKTSNDEDVLPWYRQFWAWFILTPLIVVVISCSITVSIAVLNSDDRVIDNYYKEGRMINIRLEEDLAASALGLSAKISVDQELGELVIRLNQLGEHFPDTLFLEMSHPAEKNLDRTLILKHIAQGQYHTELDQVFQYRWYLRLRPDLLIDNEEKNAVSQPVSDEKQYVADAKTELWRLRGEIDFAHQGSQKLLSILLTPDT